MGFTLDLTNDTAENVESTAMPDAGWHLAEIDDVTPNDKDGEDIKFRIVAGKSKGCKVRERIGDPDFADTESTRDVVLKKLKIWATRLRLISKDDFGKPGVTIDFVKAIGKQVVIQVIHKAGNNGTMYANVNFDGIYLPDNEHIPNAVRKVLGLPEIAGQETPQGKPVRSKKGTGTGTGAGANNGPAVQDTVPGAPPIDVSNL